MPPPVPPGTTPGTPGTPPAWTSWPAGTRVVVRRRLDPAEVRDDRTLTDVLGVVVSATPDVLTLRRDAGGDHAARRGRPDDARAGEVVTIPVAAIVAGKVVPPRPPRRLPRRPVR